MTNIIDGKQIAEEVLEGVKNEISGLGFKPRLDIVIIGNDDESHLYVNLKRLKGEEIGAQVVVHHEERIKLSELITKINSLNNDSEVNGYIIQMPIPEESLELDQYDGITSSYEEAINLILDEIEPGKDVDGMSAKSLGRTLLGQKGTTISATALSVLRILEEIYETDDLKSALSGKDILLINRSVVVGKPLAAALINLDATLTIAHSKTKEIEKAISMADIVITGTGIEKFITGEMIKDGAVLIDVGVSKKDKKVRGDVDVESVLEKASHLTPVPGGVGPLTVAMLFKNLVDLAKLNSKQ